MEHLVRLARHPDVTVLLEGESGTGKTQLARQFHDISPRSKGPFRLCALSAIHDELAYSDLFGHVAGAFTDARHPRTGLFASAAGGTVFLDEVGKASPKVQRMLLHAVERRSIQPGGSDREVPVNVRLVTASNVALTELRDRGEFLPDLHARLKGFRVVLPPLRERAADIPTLVQHLLAIHAPSCGYEAPPQVEQGLQNALCNAKWPDNLRELDATVLRLLIDAERAPLLTLDHCAGDLAYLTAIRKPRPGALQPTDIARALEGDTNITKAAQSLGVHRTTVHRILKRNNGRAD